ncbi:phospholipid-translocating P-type ATPase [Neoconidiobolus thromboides FSU 785]|nr:phospholipid-translocating P-type ATPase [Neoconidiobolus thromboides FSU 785]
MSFHSFKSYSTYLKQKVIHHIPFLSRFIKANNDLERPNSFILRSKSHRGSDISRKIYINLSPNDRNVTSESKKNDKVPFKNNKIVTTKYTLLTFIPKNLFEQFRRVANLYFLGMAILQLTPDFLISNPAFVVLPILTVIAITAIKDAFEDWKRWQADKKFNSTQTNILSNFHNYNYDDTDKIHWYTPLLKPFKKLSHLFSGSPSPSLVESGSGLFKPVFDQVLWEDVRVGDIIRIKKDESIPADILLLSSSEPDGECYIETKNLDGETNLKPRSSIKETSHLREASDCSRLQGIIDCGAPTSNLFVLNGSISLIDSPEHEYDPLNTNSSMDFRLSSLAGKPIPFSIKNILLRGCTVKNTDYAIGIVLYTGGDTKIILNSSRTPSKRSKIEKMMNKQVMASFFLLVILALVVSIGYGIIAQKWIGTPVALLFGFPTEQLFYNSFVNFWGSLILLQNFIPVSLYVSIEFVKSWQAFFIYEDIEMYHEPTDSLCIPKSWNLSDDLGQVEYVFSDKTGTLTRNIMEFKKCSINGKIYGLEIPGKESEIGKRLSKRISKRATHQQNSSTTDPKLIQTFFSKMKNLFTPKYANLDPKKVTFADPNLYDDLAKKDDQADAIKQFFLNLALCHTVLIETDKSLATQVEDNNKELIYRAESPDEKALVSAAKDLGFVFKNKNKDIFEVEMLGQEYEFEQLNLIEFDSTRKRMSVILQRPAPWNDIIVFCKGADNVILERLAPNQSELKESTLAHIKEFSSIGLRTLCLGYRIITRNEFDEWNEKYRSAQANNQNRDEELEKLQEEIEADLILMGSTAIEDKLQEKVPECIEALRKAGIKVWVLTGDKMETAINIGFGCLLLTHEMKIWTVNSGTIKEIQDNFNHVVNQIGPINQITGQHAIVIDGLALKGIIDSRESMNKLIELAPYFRSVICCRTSPLQKAQVVRIIKKGHKALTLSIGDGANDVSMIQEAHVGVAIAGEEGLQASMVSDYTISQFKFLKNLLLVHGQFSYHRISEMILCFFYKNIVWTMASFWYQFYCSFSSNLFFTYTFIPLYNMIFTVAPVVILGTMDQRLTYDYLMDYPGIYKLGIKGKFFNHRLFWIYILDGIYQSLICFFGYFFLFDDQTPMMDGRNASDLEFSSATAVLVVIVANLFVIMHTRYWSWWVHFWGYASMLFVFALIIVYSFFPGEYYYVGLRMFSACPSFWLAIPLIIVASLLPRFIFFYIKITYFPDDLDLVREIKQMNRLEKRRSEKQSQS